MRAVFLFVLLLLSKAVFCQDAETIKEINKLIAPEFHFKSDTVLADDKYSVLKTKGEKVIVINSHKESSDDDFVYEEKIFVFEKLNDRLAMIDSSARFGRDGRGVQVNFSKDTIILENSHHGGEYILFYVYNPDVKKYFLKLIKNRQGWYDKENHFFSTQQTYNLATQKLFYKKEEQLVDSWKTIKTEEKIVDIILPKNFKTELSCFIDPEWTSSDVYDKIFQ